jgi:hypothetical protein
MIIVCVKLSWHQNSCRLGLRGCRDLYFYSVERTDTFCIICLFHSLTHHHTCRYTFMESLMGCPSMHKHSFIALYSFLFGRINLGNVGKVPYHEETEMERHITTWSTHIFLMCSLHVFIFHKCNVHLLQSQENYCKASYYRYHNESSQIFLFYSLKYWPHKKLFQINVDHRYKILNLCNLQVFLIVSHSWVTW